MQVTFFTLEVSLVIQAVIVSKTACHPRSTWEREPQQARWWINQVEFCDVQWPTTILLNVCCGHIQTVSYEEIEPEWILTFWNIV